MWVDRVKAPAMSAKARRRAAETSRSPLADETQRYNQFTQRKVAASGQGGDPKLRQLEEALATQQAVSRNAAARLKDLRHHEQQFLRQQREATPPPDWLDLAPPGPDHKSWHASPWTVEGVSIREHFSALREADFRFYEERDRRYTEVNIEREKALKIKETADLAALSLAREIQDYKDEKANNLRDQIGAERGTYATKDDLQSAIREVMATVKPIAESVTTLNTTLVSGQGASSFQSAAFEKMTNTMERLVEANAVGVGQNNAGGISELVTAVDKLVVANSTAGGQSAGRGQIWQLMVGAAAIIATLIVLFRFIEPGGQVAQVPAPIIIRCVAGVVSPGCQ